MKSRLASFFVILMVALTLQPPLAAQTLVTNKDSLLTVAVQGRIAPAQPSRGYIVTWDTSLAVSSIELPG